MTPYRFFSTIISSTTAMGLDNSFVRRAGSIVAVDWTVTLVGAATPTCGRLAICWSSANAMNTSDTSLVLAEIPIAAGVGLATTANWCFQKFCPLNMPVLDGEQLFLNWQNDSGSALTISMTISAIMWVQDKGAERRIVRS